MKLKELRIKNFAGMKEATVRFDAGNGLPQTAEGDFPVDPGSANGASLIIDVLDWVLFGNEPRIPELGGTEARAIELEFDNFAVHRKVRTGTPGVALRFFRYGSNRFACVATVKELSEETLDQTQERIEDATGCSDISKFRDYLLQNAAESSDSSPRSISKAP
jgi:hypothetical protein